MIGAKIPLVGTGEGDASLTPPPEIVEAKPPPPGSRTLPTTDI